jgi:hypothetical protein
MATQYVNKATLNGTTTIYWVTTGAADNVGTYSGYNPANLTNIGVDYTTELPATYSAAISPTPGILRGTFANRPAAGNVGQVYLTSDGPLNFYDDGSNWQPFGTFGSMYTSTPLVNTLTAINAGGRSTTSTDTNGGFTMVCTNGTNADDLRILKRSATAPYTFTVHLIPTLGNASYSSAGVIWRNSTSGNIQFCGIIHSSGATQLIWRNESANNNGTSPTYTTGTDVVSLATNASATLGNGLWLRLTDDNANRTLQYSNDGFTFFTVSTIARATGITPDEVGVFIGNANSGSTSAYSAAFFDSWSYI